MHLARAYGKVDEPNGGLFLRSAGFELAVPSANF